MIPAMFSQRCAYANRIVSPISSFSSGEIPLIVNNSFFHSNFYYSGRRCRVGRTNQALNDIPFMVTHRVMKVKIYIRKDSEFGVNEPLCFCGFCRAFFYYVKLKWTWTFFHPLSHPRCKIHENCVY